MDSIWRASDRALTCIRKLCASGSFGSAFHSRVGHLNYFSVILRKSGNTQYTICTQNSVKVQHYVHSLALSLFSYNKL